MIMFVVSPTAIESRIIFFEAQKVPSDNTANEFNNWGSPAASTANAISSQPKQEKTKEEEQKPQVTQAAQAVRPAQTSSRPATASQILATIQNPARSRLAPVAKPAGLDPVAILRERESRYFNFEKYLKISYFKKFSCFAMTYILYHLLLLYFIEFRPELRYVFMN